MTDQPTPDAATFVLWLDASDGSIPALDGVRWPDGTATIHHRNFPGITSTHASPEAACQAAHGKQGRIVWDNARTTEDDPATSSDEADNGLRVRYSAAIDEGFRTFDADETDGYLIDHITDAVLACRNADLAALRVWLSTEAATCRRNADAATVDEAAQALSGMAAGCELAVRVIDGMTAGRGLPVSGGAGAGE